MIKTKVVIGLFGTRLDAGHGKRRWRKWRPTVSIAQHEALPVDRMALLYEPAFEHSARFVKKDIEELNGRVQVDLFPVPMDDPWDFEQVYEGLHTFARTYPFKPQREEYLIHITTGTHVAQICLFLLAESGHLPGKLLQTSPPPKGSDSPGDFVTIDLDLSKYDRIASRFERERIDDVTLLKAGIQTRNPAFNKMIEQLERVALASTEPILLTGPTGAGKSQLARRIYQLRKHRHQVTGDLVEVNCATLRGDNAMSALFGHVRGAFTGAIESRPGLLKKANGGLLFLDEIGELGLDEQAMLLHALETKRFLPMGSDRSHSSDFQLIAGSNRDLKAGCENGQFREDLLARINMWTFRLPPLVERTEDLEPNLEHELERASQRVRLNVSMSAQARARFLGFASSPEATWRGNFRDFGAAIIRMATLAKGGRIDVETVDEELERLKESWRPSEKRRDPVEALLGAEGAAALDRFDRVQLADVLQVIKESSSLSAAGRALFAESREKRKSVNDGDRLRKYLAKFGITLARLKEVGWLRHQTGAR